ncbi:MAG: hypothetical protein J6J66_02930 [Clostridia bacterium]|nr:hypothetical protein [Clostridia bacterium]
MDIGTLLKNGKEGYGPAVMWFTSGKISKEEMTYQLEGFLRAGLKDFFIHPVMGTEGDYLGPYFFDMIRHARDEAKRLGMRFWIYDEYNWSSGVAAGQVLKNAPFAHGRCLLRIEETVESGERKQISLPPAARFHTELLLVTRDGEPLRICAENDCITYQNETERAERISVFVSKWDLGKIAALKNSEVVERDEEGYLDTLDPEAVDAFIASTHEKYKTEIGADFGGAVKGVFCDEVITYFDFHEWGSADLKTLPWSRRFAERFEKRCGYDITKRLYDLMEGRDKRLLIDYWESVAAMMMEGFAGRTYTWCNQNRLIATGHIDGEESIFSQVYRSGDCFEFYKRFGMPGIDSILTYFRTGDFTFAITPKLVSSAAHFLGKERVLCETFTVSGWEITLADMKRAINKLLLLGVNFVQYMGARYDFNLATNAGAMTNNFQNPLFRHYGKLSHYTEALQAFVASTEYDAHTLLFYPMTTARAFISGRTLVGEWDHPLNMTLCGAVNALLSLQIPFEIGFEQVIDAAEVKDGGLWVDGRYYGTVILPETEYLKQDTYERLSAFAKGGGRLIALNGHPLKVIGESVAEVCIPGMLSVNCREYEITGENCPATPHGQPFDGYQYSGMGAFTRALSAALGNMDSYPLSIRPQNGILSAFRKDKDGYYAFIVNDTEKTAEVRGRLHHTSDASLFDTESGEERFLHRDGAAFSLTLAPFASAILWGGRPAEVKAEREAARCTVALSPVRFSIKGENFSHFEMRSLRGALLDSIVRAHREGSAARVCALANEASEENSVLCRAADSPYLPKTGKRDYLGWTPIDKKSAAPKETVACIYDFTLDTPLSSLKLVCDPDWGTVYYLNGARLAVSGTERVWHYRNLVYRLTDTVRVGKNRLVAVCTMPDYPRAFPLPAPVLMGDFRQFSPCRLTAREGEDGFGYWNDKGYMTYGGDGVYETAFTYDGEGGLMLSLETKDTVEVFVNGVSAGVRYCAPYRLDITALAKKGENTLALAVTSTLSPFLYKPTASGLLSATLEKL